jgi:hypothetical protein
MTMAPLAWLVLLVPMTPSTRADEPRTLRAGTDAEVARALADAKPGDTVLLADGKYTQSIVFYSC